MLQYSQPKQCLHNELKMKSCSRVISVSNKAFGSLIIKYVIFYNVEVDDYLT
jgi:hypothetical protein